MATPLTALRDHFERRRYYLNHERPEIAQTNMTTLRYATLLTVVLVAMLLVAAELLIRNWVPSPYHIAFLPWSIVLCVIVWAQGRNPGYARATALCVLFQATLYLFVILIDTAGGPYAPSSFVQLVCVAMPSLFILPATINYGILIAAEAVYAALVLWLKSTYAAEYDLFGIVAGTFFSVCVSQLVMGSRLKVHELKLRFETISKRDTLSSLYNKRAFFESAQRYLEKNNPSCTCSLAIIDIDDFKRINDTLGHDAGDRVITGLGDILLELYRPTDLVARFGGDEFVVLADHMVDPSIIQHRADELGVRIAEKSAESLGVPITFSMGAIYAVGQKVDYATMFQQADEALYSSKGGGKNTATIKRYHEA